MTQERPELRIIESELWTEGRARLATVRERYAKGEQKIRGELTFKRALYLLSGILVCRECGAPMTMMGGEKYCAPASVITAFTT